MQSNIPSGLPRAELYLKPGWNNNVIGLCNGTRLIVRIICRIILHYEIITGVKKGDIPRIALDSLEEITEMPEAKTIQNIVFEGPLV